MDSVSLPKLADSREAERLRGLRVDHKIELGRLLNGQIGGLGTLEDFCRAAWQAR